MRVPDPAGLTIRAVDAYLVDSGSGKNWLFAHLRTEEGVDGWGECYTYPDREIPVAATIDQLARYIAGRPVSAREFMQFAVQDFGGKRDSLELYAAVSGIEQAMWDAVGKAAGLPVYQLLGGSLQRRLRVYANGWSYADAWNRKPIEEVAESARAVTELGFTAMKFDPFPGPWRPYIDRAEERSAVDCVRVVREAVGNSVDVLIEGHRRLSATAARRFAARVEPFGPFWLEEPVVATDVSAMAAIRRRTSIPIVTGETLYGKVAFRDVLSGEAADILNPDVGACGGIAELQAIASMADAHTVGIAPHNYNSATVALAAAAHVCATIPNFVILECFIDTSARAQALAETPPPVEDGHLVVSSAPGLGVQLIPSILEEHPYRAFGLRSFRSSTT